LNGIQFWHKMPFCIFFKKNPRELPYMYACMGCNKSVCKQVICDAYGKRFTQIEQEKYMLCLPKSNSPVWQTGTSGLARKTEISGLYNWTI
jgi:hypothetical protein